MPEFYSVTITQHDDPDGAASFRIEPPLKYLSPESKTELEAVLRQLILDRMGKTEDDGLWLAITHNTPDNTATVGRAWFRGLQLSTGKTVLQQALELGLNGTNDYVSPNSPLRS